MREHRDLIAERSIGAGEFAVDRGQIRRKLVGFDITDTRHPSVLPFGTGPRPPRFIAAPPHPSAMQASAATTGASSLDRRGDLFIAFSGVLRCPDTSGF